MVDKTLSEMANPLFFDSNIVNGLFRWTESVAAVKNTPVKLAGADGPPIDVDAVDGAGQQSIGVVLEGGSATNEMVTILTLYHAVISIVCGGTCTRGSKVKTDASGEVTDALIGDVGTGATGATETRVLGVALQSGAAADIIYIGLTH